MLSCSSHLRLPSALTEPDMLALIRSNSELSLQLASIGFEWMLPIEWTLREADGKPWYRNHRRERGTNFCFEE